MRRTAPLIVGGGPAGSAVAIRLAQAGVRAALIERSSDAHDPVCGGFLGWDALAGLSALGIDVWAIGAQPITRLRIVAGSAIAEADLPYRAAGLSRRTLDAALLAHAALQGTRIDRGVAARAFTPDGVRLANGVVLRNESIFLATGKHDVRGAARTAGPHGNIGLRTTIPAPPDLSGWIELHLYEGGYAGLAMQEDGTANLCLSATRQRLASAHGSADLLMDQLAGEAPRLARRWQAGRIAAWSAVTAVPYGWRATGTDRGWFRIGDQAAVIASLAGDGVAIALASGRAAADAWLAGGAEAAPAFQWAFAQRARRPIAIAERLRHLAQRPHVARPLTRLFAMVPAPIGLAARFTRIGA